MILRELLRNGWPPVENDGPIAATLQNAIDDMRLPIEALRKNGYPDGTYHGIQSSSYLSQVAMTPAGVYDFADAWDCVLPWFWCWEAAGNTATNTRVALRYPKCWLRLDQIGAGGSWVSYDLTPGRTARTRGYVNRAVNADESYIGDQIWHADGITTSVRPGLETAIELWPWDGIQDGGFSFSTPSTTLMHRVRGIYVEIESQLILHDPLGTDDRAQARYILCAGYDLYSRQNQASGIIGRPGPDQYPIHAMDGGFGRYKLVGSTKQIHSVSPLESCYTIGRPYPWGDWSSRWEYQAPPWTFTLDQFRSFPPSHLTR